MDDEVSEDRAFLVRDTAQSHDLLRDPGLDGVGDTVVLATHYLSVNTVKTHMRHVHDKLGATKL